MVFDLPKAFKRAMTKQKGTSSIDNKKRIVQNITFKAA